MFLQFLDEELYKPIEIEPPKTLNTATMRANLCLTAISKLINVILAYAINKPEYLRSITKLLKIVA